MKIVRIFTFIFILFISVWAKSILISPLPLPTNEILDIELQECDDDCLIELLDEGKIFSFLAKAKKNENKIVKENFLLLSSALNISPSLLPYEKIKVAIILPTKKIGNYAISTTKSVISYLLFKKARFHLKTYEIEDDDYETLLETIKKIKEDGMKYVIAPLTLNGAKNLCDIDEKDINFFVPTINRNDLESYSNTNIIFGGIDYKKQIDSLLEYSNEKIIVFNEANSPLAFKLSKIVEFESNSSIDIIDVKDEATNLKRYFYKNKDINSSTIFLNTPIVKSSLILSQMTLYDLKPQAILSTQINFNPLIFSLTQPIDRENLILANSIHNKSNILEEYNQLLNNDIEYNWINYSTSLGIDLFFNKKTYKKRVFDEKIDNNQIVYDVTLHKALNGKFFTIFQDFETDQEILQE